MDRKLLIVFIVIVIIAVLGIIAALTLDVDETMKVASFNGIMMEVPADAKFIKTVDGFKDLEYGITIRTFSNNQDMVDYLKSIKNGKMVSLTNQPPNSVAFVQNNLTNILVTNGHDGICVGCIDEDLLIEMSHTIVFENGEEASPDKGFFGVKNQVLNPKIDFSQILPILKKANNQIFNNSVFINSIVPAIIEGSNSSVDEESDSSAINKNYLGTVDCNEIIRQILVDGDTVSSVDYGDGYTFNIENSYGEYCGSITIDPETGEIISNSYFHIEHVENDMPNQLQEEIRSSEIKM